MEEPHGKIKNLAAKRKNLTAKEKPHGKRKTSRQKGRNSRQKNKPHGKKEKTHGKRTNLLCYLTTYYVATLLAEMGSLPRSKRSDNNQRTVEVR